MARMPLGLLDRYPARDQVCALLGMMRAQTTWPWQGRKIMTRTGATIALASAVTMLATLAWSQETKPAAKYGDMSLVTQDLLDRAANDGSNFLHTNGDYT